MSARPNVANRAAGCVVEAFRPVARRTLRGFARVRFPSGLIVDEIAIHFGADDGRAWASPPSRPMVDRDGNAIRDGDGKIKYAGLIAFSTAHVRNAWSDTVIAALRASHPEAFK